MESEMHKRWWAVVALIICAVAFGIWLKRASVLAPLNPSATSECCIPAEYDPVESVLVSEHLFAPKYGGAELARYIVEIGLDLIILTNRPLTSADEDQLLHDWGIGSIERGKLHFITAPHSSPWVRDYAPMVLVPEAPKAGPPQLIDFSYRTDAMLDDGLPYLLGMQWNQSVRRVRAFMDGGNFLISDERCFAAASDDEKLDEQLKEFAPFGCRQITLVPNIFHEHIDMFVKFTGPGTALVNQIETPILELAREHFAADFPMIEAAAAALDDAAKIISRSHRVARLPTPLPILNLRRTYANAVLLNGHALLPRFRASFRLNEPYPDQKFADEYERRAIKMYEAAGFRVRTFPADGMIADGGTLHCALVHLPFRLSELPAN
jgi:hypothetical protein